MTTEHVRSEGLDKFYTKPEIAIKCISRIENYEEWDLVIEPSAGSGSFYDNIQSSNKIGLDIKPASDGIQEMDFFEYIPPPTSKKILVIGNPPFGKNSSLAVKFFNHAAKWADCIAFIIPKTFRRISIQNQLNMSFHLTHDDDIPMKPCSFEPMMSVKCCFQIWKKYEIERTPINLPTTHKDWNFLPFGSKDDRNQPTPPSGADFALLAYGGCCGRLHETDLEALRPKSWHWIKSNIDIDVLKRRFGELDYSMSENTARQNSIGKSDLVYLYSSKFDHNLSP
jgi:hypothetical protein